MRFVKRSERSAAQVSVVLLDWSVREQMQILHYLREQNASRDQYDVVVVEYYGLTSPAVAADADVVDTWVMLDMPATSYYHKHLMYNAGIVLARGEIIVFCDSDAMVRPSFIDRILATFETEGQVVLHLDQFRNERHDLYPFAHPTFAEVIGPGCINNAGGRPRGLVTESDPLHERNYGACMAARRADLVAVGGADEHGDYLGHICGPYELTFRLGNAGVREVWHQTEFLYHTWHPGQAGAGNYLGPHDGRHMSMRALEALTSGRTRPVAENPAIARLRTTPQLMASQVEADLIAPDRPLLWARRDSASGAPSIDTSTPFDYHGFRVDRPAHAFVAHLIVEGGTSQESHSLEISSDSAEDIRKRIDEAADRWLRLMNWGGWACVLLSRGRAAWRAARRRVSRGGAGAPVTASTAVVHIGERLRRLLAECVDGAACVRGLLVNLQRLRRDAEEGTIVVLLCGRMMRLYVRGLSVVRLLPRLDVIAPRDAQDLEALLSHLGQVARARHVIVTRELYFTHYPRFLTATRRAFRVV